MSKAAFQQWRILGGDLELSTLFAPQPTFKVHIRQELFMNWFRIRAVILISCDLIFLLVLAIHECKLKQRRSHGRLPLSMKSAVSSQVMPSNSRVILVY